MPRFGWTSLGYLLFVLTVLAVLVRLDDQATETRSLAAELLPRDTTTTAGETTVTGDPTSAAADAVREARQSTGMTRRIEGAVSSLVDLEGSASAPRSPRPRASVPPVTTETTPPVFYRPSSGEALSARTTGPVCGDLGRFPRSSRVVFPLERAYFYSYEDTWGAPRTQGGHEGTDLMAPAGAPEYAVTDGTVVPVAGSNEDGWNTLGGYAVMVRADYSIGPVEEGDLFYYAHLRRRSDLKLGTRVRAGQVIGYAGDTGQGPQVTRGLFPPHLHLGWYDATGTRSSVDSGAMNPYPLLEWIKANGGAVTGGSNARYCEAPSPPTPAPSTGEKGWPAPDAPGLSPDLDTGSKDPRPSPVARNAARARTAPTQRAAPTKGPARVSQDLTPRRDRREAPAGAPEAERPRTPKPPTPGTSEPQAERPQKPEPPRREPSSDDTPKPPASGEDAPPSNERPSPSPAEEQYAGVSPARVNPQDLLEVRIPDLDREPADTGKRDHPGEDERDERHERERDEERDRAEERGKQDREEKPAVKEPEESPEPWAGYEPAEDEPSTPEPETDDPDESDEAEPETTDQEPTEPETTEPVSETTVFSETTER